LAETQVSILCINQSLRSCELRERFGDRKDLALPHPDNSRADAPPLNGRSATFDAQTPLALTMDAVRLAARANTLRQARAFAESRSRALAFHCDK
jgi:hypothetical protein